MPVPLIAAGVGLVGSAIGAFASQGAANAQQAAATNAQNMAISAVQPSFGQMQAIQSQYQMSSNLLSTQLTNLQSQYSLYQSASSQAQALMNGQAASTLGPLQQQQQLQRQQLQQQLESQLGPGYATSSAGSMALANFDMQSQFATSQAQSQATGMYLNASETLGGQYTQGLNSAYATSANINQSGIADANQLQQMKLGAVTGTNNNVISTAGAPFVGQAQMAGAVSNMAGNVLGQISGGNPSGGGGGGTPNQTAGQLYASGGSGTPSYLGGSNMASQLGNPSFTGYATN